MQAARGASLTSDALALRGLSNPRARFGLVLGVAAFGWALDASTKALAVRELADRAPVEVLGSFLRLNLVRNPGAAFSAGTGLTPWISLFGCVALVVAVVLARKVRTPLWGVAMGLLIAGIVGNLTDRFLREPGPLRGHVIDFLELPNWPVFNVADICINLAAVLIVLQSFRGVPMAGRPAARSDQDGSAGDEAESR